ncbi:MAG TPA: hypothetical protein VHK91_00945 [Flavisolibacter sp.]|jgi:hypothetical protein|nr:hypothetical protein [Flavisolibacter sp.]
MKRLALSIPWMIAICSLSGRKFHCHSCKQEASKENINLVGRKASSYAGTARDSTFRIESSELPYSLQNGNQIMAITDGNNIDSTLKNPLRPTYGRND